jgi:hypothetical protein
MLFSWPEAACYIRGERGLADSKDPSDVETFKHLSLMMVPDCQIFGIFDCRIFGFSDSQLCHFFPAEHFSLWMLSG